MSLIDEALKRARLDAARQDAARDSLAQAPRGAGFASPWEHLPASRRRRPEPRMLALGAAMVLCLAVGAAGIALFLRAPRPGGMGTAQAPPAVAAGAGPGAPAPAGGAGPAEDAAPRGAARDTDRAADAAINADRPAGAARATRTLDGARDAEAAGSPRRGARGLADGAAPTGGSGRPAARPGRESVAGGDAMPGHDPRGRVEDARAGHALAQPAGRAGPADGGAETMVATGKAGAQGSRGGSAAASSALPGVGVPGMAGSAGAVSASSGAPASSSQPPAPSAVGVPPAEGAAARGAGAAEPGAAAPGGAAAAPGAGLPVAADGGTYAGEVRLADGSAVKLSGIAYSDASPVVVLNGKVLGPGQGLDQVTVDRIEPDRVTLRLRSGIVFYLRLN